MKPLILFIDLQNDFLNAAGCEPEAAEVVRAAARLLEGARTLGVPVVHAVTRVDRAADDRMPHWKSAGIWRCVEGTPGYASPAELAPRGGEAVVTKTFFSAFSSSSSSSSSALAGALAAADTLIVAGVHLHGCVRATVLDAYARGLTVWVAEDAVGSDDPVHAAVTRRYLDGRAARFAPVAELLARMSSTDRGPGLPRKAPATTSAAPAVAAASAVRVSWRSVPGAERSRPLLALADRFERDATAWARELAAEIGKPVTHGEAEARRTAELLRAAAATAALRIPGLDGPVAAGPDSAFRRVPLGVVAVVTPWNNPLAIPWGKIGPALALGNVVVWKPSPAATGAARRSLETARSAGLPAGVVELVEGGAAAAAALLSDPAVDGASLTGSSAAGWAAQEICARRRIPLQAELGGNNAAIVWTGADLADAASKVARGAFGFAGQRCTANRRAIVAGDLFEEFLSRLSAATAALAWGDPFDPLTEVGPLVSVEARDRVAAVVARARAAGARVVAPHGGAPSGPAAYHPPTIVVDPRPDSEIVQSETFGPVLVLQRAGDFEEALRLANGVRQGLAASLFSGSGPWREKFAAAAEAGILKWNAATADADAFAPFGGWKASGLGPPEHGAGDVEFYTRIQTIYGHGDAGPVP
jgi:acyl-CoA reductase-like NAD-dependent aldehyde dehydrogenase